MMTPDQIAAAAKGSTPNISPTSGVTSPQTAMGSSNGTLSAPVYIGGSGGGVPMWLIILAVAGFVLWKKFK